MGADPSQVAMAVDREEEESDEEEVLVEEREAEMVSLQNPDAPVRRKGWFLKSSSPNGNVGNSPPLVPSFFKSPNSVPIEEPKVQFKGWASSPRQWEQWVAKLLPKYGAIWKKVHIFDAILASTCRIRRDPSSLFGLVSHWCEETNTFLFPWGEITVTLEDIIILTGFSVLGEPVRAPLPPELREIENKLNEERLKFNRSSSKKAHHSAWVKEFIERENDELEHAAFLSLWLSRFVLCSHPESTIRQNVFPIAARLSKGQRIALAPSILSSIYRDLREIKRSLTNSSTKEGSLVCWAPLQILQIWIWERFPNLRPETQNPLKDNQPRAARWHDVGKKLHPVLVQSTLSSHTNFLFRPYAISSSDWYKDGLDELIRDDELRSFAQCLCPCELVGLDCIEFYLPNRVAMQFGFDQDLPNLFKRVDFGGWEMSWQSYEITADNMSLYVPPQPFEPGLTVQYMSWWREKMMPCFGNSVGFGNSGIGSGIGEGGGMSVGESSGNKGKNKRNKKVVVGSSPDKKRKVKEFYDASRIITGENRVEGGIMMTGENKMEGMVMTENKMEGIVMTRENKMDGITTGENKILFDGEKGKDLMVVEETVAVQQDNVMMSERTEEVTMAEREEVERENLDPNPIPIMIPNPIMNLNPVPNPIETTNQEIITQIDQPQTEKTEEKEEEIVEQLVITDHQVLIEGSSSNQLLPPVSTDLDAQKQTIEVIPITEELEKQQEEKETQTETEPPKTEQKSETESPVPVSVPVNTETEPPAQVPVLVPNQQLVPVPGVPVTDLSSERNTNNSSNVTTEEESEHSRERKWRYERYAAEMKARRQAEEAREQRELAILRRDLELLKEEVLDLETLAGITHE